MRGRTAEGSPLPTMARSRVTRCTGRASPTGQRAPATRRLGDSRPKSSSTAGVAQSHPETELDNDEYPRARRCRELHARRLRHDQRSLGDARRNDCRSVAGPELRDMLLGLMPARRPPRRSRACPGSDNSEANEPSGHHDTLPPNAASHRTPLGHSRFDHASVIPATIDEIAQCAESASHQRLLWSSGRPRSW